MHVSTNLIKQFNGLDLSLLASALYPPNVLNEADELWDFDTLIAEVASQMQQEEEQSIKEDDDEKDVKKSKYTTAGVES